jgi:hypothetical protein
MKSNKQRRISAIKELESPRYVFVGSVADVLEKHKLFSKADVDFVVAKSSFELPRGSKKFLYEQLKLRKVV